MNAYDSACLLLAAIKDASTVSKGYPSRRDVLAAVRDIRFRGNAYREPVRWDEKGDNLAAVTALNGVENGRFRQIAEIQQMQRSSRPDADRLSDRTGFRRFARTIFTGPRNHNLRSPFRPQNLSRRRR
ncbi:hypothetical protein [Mesorhizobium sp. M1023]|uniref:hypothetical protein n=1 Tax=Mesorhizobium sp. M1023 TaxID=2957049 RepID=UPI00333DD1FE